MALLLAMIGLCTLAWTAGNCTPVWAAAKVKAAWVQSLQIIDPVTGHVLPPHVHLKYNQKASARCEFEFMSEGGPPSQIPPFNVLMSDFKNRKRIDRSINVWDPHIKYDGALGRGYAIMPIYTGPNRLYGTDSIMCVSGSKITRIDFSIEESPPVKKPLLSFNRRELDNLVSTKHGLVQMPNAHVRQCPTSVKAISKIDPRGFSSPFSTASKPTNIPNGHLNLYLNKVEAFNNTLLCTYATHAGNAKTTVEFSCKNARLSDKASHAYYCQ